MASIRKELVNDVMDRAFALTDYDTDIDKRNEFIQQTIYADESLTNEEKSKAILESNRVYEYYKVTLNQGNKRICENCKQECLAISYCEHCIRSYLKANFSEWTSGNNEIDNLIKRCQMVAIQLYRIV